MGVEETVSRSEFLRGVLGIAAAAGSFRAGAAIAVIGQPRPPALTGPYQDIGVKYTRVAGARCKVFYPAHAPSDTAAPYCTDGRATSDGMAGLVGFRQLGLSFLLGHLADAPSGCWLNAPPAQTDQALPLLCYSHGMGGNMDMATYLMRQFASHGVIVAALEHTDGTSSRTVLDDGSELTFSPGRSSREQQLRTRASELLSAAAPGALGDSLPPIDAAKVSLGGHSYGGPAALLASALAPSQSSAARVASLLLHDPALGMNAAIDVATRIPPSDAPPVLSYVSDEYDRYGVRCGFATYHTIGGFHGNFVDAPLWAPRWVMRPLSALIPAAGPADACALHDTLARTGSAFLRRGDETATRRLFASSRLLELRGGLCNGSPSPSAAMHEWRSARLRRFGRAYDASRYHAQVLL